MIHYICALQCEARPLLRHFSLHSVAGPEPLKIYASCAGDRSLTVSGVGGLAAAGAVMAAAKHFRSQPHHAWVNMGIAGHASMEPGAIALAHTVRRASDGASWYPRTIFPSRLPRLPLLTVDAPADEYGDTLVDMEAAGFCSAASRLTILELMQVIKVVSDSPRHPARSLSAAKVAQLIELNLEQIDAVDHVLVALSSELQDLYSTPPHYGDFLEHRHFSVTQRYRLEKLLRRWDLLCPQSDPLRFTQNHRGSTTDLLNRLQDELDCIPFQL